MTGKISASKPSTMSFPFVSLNCVDAIFALLMIGLLSLSAVGSRGTTRTGIDLWALGLLGGRAESVKGVAMELKIMNGMKQPT